MTGIERIAAERRRQVEQEGWTPEHDNQHSAGELSLAAIAYADCDPFQHIRENRVVIEDKRQDCVIHRDPWPWDLKWDKRKKHSAIRRLEIAGALIAAEIDRLLRAKEQH